ncbi:response regulator [Luteolibacter sp. Populi]|uniref:response regulator n=1 Tax=Luteolibacter sp. Populi TaxID=3230487 RepID=UPI0034662642
MNAPHPASYRILVVDDNQGIHEDFRKILGGDPVGDGFEEDDAAFFGTPAPEPTKVTFDLDFASQGLEAVEMAAAATCAGRRYSVVFMDVRMPPGLDGIETTSRLWKIDPELQVVICTAYSDYSWEEMIGRLGHTDRLLILKKPFDMIEVVQCAHALTSKWSLQQQTRRHAESLELAVRERTSQLETTNKRLEEEVAERRRSEEALRFTQFSVDNAPEAMFWAAPDSRLVYANAATCKTLGYSTRELQELSVSDIVPEIGGDAWPAFWESLQAARHRTFEARHRAKDGSEIPIEFTAALFTFDGKELLCASARDITIRKHILAELSAARDAALESVRMKGRFLANMSHEIRTPMNGVIGMAELLLHTNLDRDQRDYVDTVRTSADSLLNLINDILDSSKIESGMLNFELLEFDLGDVVEGTLDIVGGVARNKGLELAVHIHEGVPCHLRGDAGRLRQVLMNILGNAVKFTARGEVALMVTLLEETETAARLRFEVRDTGIGIAEELRQRIFEPFVQADGSETRKYGGTGLGLSICRQIVEAQGGEIGVDSEPGQSSTFWFNLAFSKHAAPPRQLPRSLDCPPNLRVLVVDDNATNLKILQLQLSNLQMRPCGVASGDEALGLLRRESSGADPFSLAIVDMQMPGMDGLTLARLIKSEPAIAPTRLIILSSLGDHFADRELAAAGVEGHLVKPIKQARLHEALCALFYRPLPQVRTEEVAAPEPAREKPGPALPLRILLAEDNPVNQKVALLQLRNLGYEADLAGDGAEALEMLGRIPYDVILMDCQMPVMDGFAATREIRRSYPHPVRIIAMTANAMQGDRERCLEAGMDAFLSKPVRAADLGRALQECKPPGTSASPSPPADLSSAPAAPVNLERLLEVTGHDTEMFRQIVHDYLEQAEEILCSMVLAIEGRSADGIRDLAHKLCGSSNSCGMEAIVPPLRRLEQLGKAAQFDAVQESYQDAVRQLNRIRRFLVSHLADLPPASPSNS